MVGQNITRLQMQNSERLPQPHYVKMFKLIFKRPMSLIVSASFAFFPIINSEIPGSFLEPKAPVGPSSQ